MEKETDKPLTEADHAAARRAMSLNHPEIAQDSIEFQEQLEAQARFHQFLGPTKFELYFNLREPGSNEEKWSRDFMQGRLTEDEYGAQLRSDAERPIDMEMLQTFHDTITERLEHYSKIIQLVVAIVHEQREPHTWVEREREIDIHAAEIDGKFSLWKENLTTVVEYLEELRVELTMGQATIGDDEGTCAHWLAVRIMQRTVDAWQSYREIAGRSQTDPRYLYSTTASALFFKQWYPQLPNPRNMSEKIREEFVRARMALRKMNSGPQATNNDIAPSDAGFDVFLSHNSKDKPAVLELGKALKQRGLTVWLDDWELAPGSVWQEELENIIRTAKTAAVLFGPSGLGPWEEPEMRACLNEFVKRKLKVIPVLLPGAAKQPELPLFLNQFTWLDLRTGLTTEGIDRLVWGITGRRIEREVVAMADRTDHQRTAPSETEREKQIQELTTLRYSEERKRIDEEFNRRRSDWLSNMAERRMMKSGIFNQEQAEMEADVLRQWALSWLNHYIAVVEESDEAFDERRAEKVESELICRIERWALQATGLVSQSLFNDAIDGVKGDIIGKVRQALLKTKLSTRVPTELEGASSESQTQKEVRMSQEEKPMITRNFLQHLAKGEVKCIPVFGGLVEEMIFGTLSGEAAAEEAAKLETALAELQEAMKDQQISVTDALARLHGSAELAVQTKSSIYEIQQAVSSLDCAVSEQLNDAVDIIIENHREQLGGVTDDLAGLVERLENAMANIPSTVETPASDERLNPLQTDRVSLIAALNGLTDEDLSTLVTAMEADQHVSQSAPVRTKAIQLIRWAGSRSGPGLAKVFDTARTVIPNFI